jgi:CheY-like chemotaxis protein/signal transduction histidine kinase
LRARKATRTVLAAVSMRSKLQQQTPLSVYLAIGLTIAVIFVAGLVTPLGIAIWVLYLVAIALASFARDPRAPFVTAAVCSAGLVVGYFVAPGAGSTAAQFAPISRLFGFTTLWISAVIGRQFILSRLALTRQDWLKSAQAGLAERMQGEQTLAQLGDNVLGFLVQYLRAQVGAFYVPDGGGAYSRVAQHALDPQHAGPAHVRPGEGLVGQVARDKRLLHVTQLPADYLVVRSGVGRHAPLQLIIAPAEIDGTVHALYELGFLRALDPSELELFALLSPSIGAAVRTVSYRVRQGELLEETQRQAEALQAQQEELRVQNEELEEQSRALQESQSRLEIQQVDLEQTNSQLEEQTQALVHQRDSLKRTQVELERANAYKSEFLANMSHELRTPLNSSLILAKLLVDNRDGNLNAEQIRFAETIYTAGNDLLTLINDILDLSKIEAGQLDVRPESISLERLRDDLLRAFEPLAHEKRLELVLSVDESAPDALHSDPARLQQILKNLLSNALKFTERGGVTLHVRGAGEGRVAFDVQDTGIGIPADQHAQIFEAFRQADGTTNRKYGGTGLGLSISRDLAVLLGGELSLRSEPGRGSTFTLLLPQRYVPVAGVQPMRAFASPAPRRTVGSTRPGPMLAPAPQHDERAGERSGDDREPPAPGTRTILVIEDDAAFAEILAGLVRELDFQALVAHSAGEGLAMVERHRPSAIVLDVNLPDRSGLSVLDALKHDPRTRHIPVHMLSVMDYTMTALAMGAAGYAIKPVQREQIINALQRLEAQLTRKLRRVLVVEDDEVHRADTCKLLAGDDVETVAVGTAAAALEHLRAMTFDCMVLDLSLPDCSGFELLEQMSQQGSYGFPPVIVYTARSLTREEEQTLRRFSSSIIIKGARSPERLLDEVALFLHQVESELPPDRQRMLRDARHRESVFEGRRVLVVEDDVRNIFALSSVLEPKGAKVEIARNGREALYHLQQNPGVDLVLMDIMMPEMDGHTAMREIRKQPALAKLPIIALTAKAMADDREACLAAGANDYIAKPLDVDKLLSLARVWINK